MRDRSSSSPQAFTPARDSEYMTRPAKWKIVTFTAVFGGLNLLAIGAVMAKPHLAGGNAVSAADRAPVGPIDALRSCPDTGGNAAQSQTKCSFRIRTSLDRRAAGRVHASPVEAEEVYRPLVTGLLRVDIPSRAVS